MKATLFIAVIAVFGATGVRSAQVSSGWTESWRADLRYVKETLPASHAHLFHTLAVEDFNASVDALSARVQSMSHHEVIVELATIVAAVNDGHTRLTLPMAEGSGFFRGHSSTPPPSDLAMVFRHYPIRLYIYKDGLFVRKISVENATYAAAKVVGIGSMSAEDAMRAVSPTIQRDNEMQVQLLLPSRLVIPEVLHARHVIDNMDRAKFVLETGDGAKRELVLSPVLDSEAVEWVDAREMSGEAPLYLRQTEANFWFEHLEVERTVYWQYNEVYDGEDESITEFAGRLTDFISDNNIERLVVDLRFNAGGDNSLNRSLLHALIRCPEVQVPGSLFVIVGRGTFSAAMMFAIDLEKHTNAIFVGEPTGARLNHYGDSRKVRLPNSGLTIRASTLYWQYSGPKDDRSWIAPHIAAELSSEDYRLGRDPAIEAILALSSRMRNDASPVGYWAGRLLTNNIMIRLNRSDNEWRATIDFPDQDATGLALANVRYDAPLLRFEFQNGKNVIKFEGTVRENNIIGGATTRGQVYPWVVLRER